VSHFVAIFDPAMYTRRLDDRIRQLCAKVAAAGEAEPEPLLQELLAAVHEKIERVRTLAAKQLLRREDYKERRTPRR